MPEFNPKDTDPNREGKNNYSYMSDSKLYNTIMEFLEADPKSYTLTGNRQYYFSVKEMVIELKKRADKNYRKLLEKNLHLAGMKSKQSHTEKLAENS